MQSLAFNKFQPICDKILRQRNTQDVATLYEMVKETEAYYLQNIQQFLLVPLITRMGEADSGEQQPRDRSDIKVKIIDVVKLVLEKTELRQVHALKTILIVLTKEVYEFQTAQLVPDVSEELIIGVLGCISVANRRASSDSVEQFFHPENASQICQIMYVLLLLLDKSDFREIKLKALDALMSLLHVNDGPDLSDIVLRNQISGIIFFAVPMIWTSLSKPILNDPKIGRQVIERSLVALGRILCLIMEDDKARDEERQDLNVTDFRALIISSSDPPANATSILEQKEKKRTPEWLRAAGKKLKEPFKSLITLTGNESQGIRKQVGLCCEQWMRRCRYSLEDNMDTFAEIVLILSEDEDPQISSYFSRVLNDLQGEGDRSFTTINRDLIERHLLRMSRIIHRRSEKEQFTALALLKAQLKGLPEEELVLIFSNSRSLEVFVRNLLLLIEFNYDNPVLLKEEHTIRDYVDNDASAGLTKPWEDFKYFNAKSSKVPLLLLNIMKSVRGRTSVRILIEYLTNLLKDRPANCAEILKLLQLIVSSVSPEDEIHGIEMVERLLEELLDDRYWNLSCQIVRNEDRKSGGREHLKVSEHVEGLYESSLLVKYVDLNQENELLEEYFISPQEAKINVLVSCVLLETMATCGHQLGPARYQKYVFRLLFNLLSSAGNSNLCIHSAGLLALTETTRIYKLNGIRDLIMSNSDYVMFFVNQSLRDAHRSKSALDVISVILEFCSKDVLGYVELIVNRLLEECSKYHRMVNLSAYLKIFGLFLKNLTAEAEDTEGADAKSVEDVLDAWLSILNPKPIEDDLTDSVDEESPPEEPIPEEPAVKPPPPKNVEIAQQIMKVSLKHISSRNQSEVLAAMETLTWGVSILKPHEDELLPLVHLIWAPLSRRFADENPIVLRNAFRMLITLADSAKEFIHRRTVDEVVPTLNKILKSSWTIVARTKEDGGGRFTQQFKLVQEILSNYHIVIIRLNIQQKHLDDIMSTVALYLAGQAPKALSVAALAFFEALKSFDGAAVHQKLLSSPPAHAAG